MIQEKLPPPPRTHTRKRKAHTKKKTQKQTKLNNNEINKTHTSATLPLITKKHPQKSAISIFVKNDFHMLSILFVV